MAKRTRKPRRPVQLSLPLAGLPKPGAKRAGRKPGTGLRRVRHRAREALSASHPVHVVLRSSYRPLRSRFVFPTLRQALAKATRAQAGFRVIQFSVQSDHLHLIVEARDKSALSRGMKGLAIRVARAVNKLVFRRGKVWADRFFARALPSPRALKNALGYVLNNFRKHRAEGGSRIDPYSSAPYFAGFRELRGRAPCDIAARSDLPLHPRGVSPPQSATEVPIVSAKTWLGRVGWQRAGSVCFPFAARRRSRPSGRLAASTLEPSLEHQNRGDPRFVSYAQSAHTGSRCSHDVRHRVVSDKQYVSGWYFPARDCQREYPRIGFAEPNFLRNDQRIERALERERGELGSLRGAAAVRHHAQPILSAYSRQ